MRKKQNSNIILFLMLCLFAACSSDDNKEAQIELPNEKESIQSAFANEETTGGFTFKAMGAWTATVKEGTASRATSSVSWLRLLLGGAEIYSGEAGTITLNIELDANYTKAARYATITIESGGSRITISVTQEGTDKDGNTPVEEEYELGFLLLNGDVNDDATSPDSEPGVYMRDYDFFFADEKGNKIKPIYTFKDTCYVNLENYNTETKDAYFYRYFTSSNEGSSTVSEIFSINTETKQLTTLVKHVPSYDYLKVSADGQYVVYDKVDQSNDKKGQVIKLSIADAKETVLYEGDYDNCGIGAIGKNGSIVVLYTSDDNITVLENGVQKHTFSMSSDINTIHLFPDEKKLLIEYGEDGGMLTCDLDGKNEQILNNDKPEYAVLSADGKYFYYNFNLLESTVYKLDIQNKTKTTLSGFNSPDGLRNDNAISVKLAK